MLISREDTKEILNYAIATGQIKMKTLKTRRNHNNDVNLRWKIASGSMITILDSSPIDYKWVNKNELQ